jgi:hypothetical protein
MAAMLVSGLTGCGDQTKATTPPSAKDQAAQTQRTGQLSEVAPPSVIQQLSQALEAYQPQVTIMSPQPDEVVTDTTVAVNFQVQDLPIFKNPDLGMGPHLHVILDNQPYQAVYDINQPLVFEDLSPGTHTLRVFASRPWHESFKNEGAYAQTTFHVFTQSSDNNPEPDLPLLTYSRPKGSYGAEPIMLDFYLTNAPLHLVAQENPTDDIPDWRIRVTINGESFVLDRWQPVYLKGFKPGKNWVKLEFLDEQGNPVQNVFNNTVRLINYEPKGTDTLSKLVRGELSVEAARGIVSPNYEAPPAPMPSPPVVPEPIPSPTPTITPEPIPPVAPPVEEVPEETPTPKLEAPLEEPTPPVESIPTPKPEVSPTPIEEPTSTEEATPTPDETPEKPGLKGLFNRFRRPTAAPSPTPEVTEPEVPTPAPVVEPEEPQEPEQTLEPEALPTPIESPTPIEEPTPTEEATPTPAETPKKPGLKGFFNRFRRPTAAPSPTPEVTEPEVPTPAPVVEPEEPQEPEQTLEPETLPTPIESPTPIEEPTPTEEATPTPAETPHKTGVKGLFNRFRRPSTAPSETPTAPDGLETPSTAPMVEPETPQPIPAPEELVIPSEPPTGVEESDITPEPEASEEDMELPPVITPVPIRPIQPAPPKQTTDSQLPPTLPEIVDTLTLEDPEPEPAPPPASESPTADSQATDVPLAQEVQ